MLCFRSVTSKLQKDFNLVQSKFDPCLFLSNVLMTLIYVDDFMVLDTNPALIDHHEFLS